MKKAPAKKAAKKAPAKKAAKKAVKKAARQRKRKQARPKKAAKETPVAEEAPAKPKGKKPKNRIDTPEIQEKIRELIKLAKEQEYLTYDDIHEILPKNLG